jgi:IrrE N-terminal-like domain
MTDSASDLRKRLNEFGLSDAAIEAVWPQWWSDAAEESTSARTELRFGVARRLGIDPSSLVDKDASPRFLWSSQARFKNLAGESKLEREGISSFGRAVAKTLLSGTPVPESIISTDNSALALRQMLLGLERSPFVGLADLLALSWGIGVPVAYLRVFPWDRKRMAAMAVRQRDRSAILLARDSHYPAWVAFWLAHELGHLFLSHLRDEEVIVDLDEGAPPLGGDDEEDAADAFALQLLTGEERPVVLADPEGAKPSAAGLAKVVSERGPELGIEPGTLALCYGFTTKEWGIANGALGVLYRNARPVWDQINRLALSQLEITTLPSDSTAFLSAILGQDAESAGEIN